MKKIIIYSIFIILLSFFISYSSTESQFYELLPDIKRNLKILFHGNYKIAENEFKKLIQKYPENPVGYLMVAIVYYLKAIEYNVNLWDNKIIELSKDAIKVGEKQYSKNKNDPYLLFVIGGAKGFIGITYLKNNNLLSAYRYGNSGVNILKKSLKIKSDLYDAYFGIGLFDYSASKLAKNVWYIPSAMYNDSDKGIEEMYISYRKGEFINDLSALYLINILLDENRKDEALKIARRKYKEYSNSSIFILPTAEAYFANGKLEFAENLYNKVLNIYKKRSYNITKNRKIFILYRLASIYYQRGNKQKALNYIKQIEKLGINKKYVIYNEYKELVKKLLQNG